LRAAHARPRKTHVTTATSTAHTHTSCRQHPPPTIHPPTHPVVVAAAAAAAAAAHQPQELQPKLITRRNDVDGGGAVCLCV